MRVFITMIVYGIVYGNCANGADWPQYRGIHSDGKSAESISSLSKTTHHLQQIWKIETPLGFSSFSIANGGAYTLMTQDASDGNKHEVCVAMDAKTGIQRWLVQLGSSDYGSSGGDSGTPDNKGGDGPRSTPSTDGERVYVYDSHLRLYCFDADTGEVLWEKNVAEEFGGENIRWKNAVSPLLTDRLVYVLGGGPGQAFLAFDKFTGTLVWSSGTETMTHATPILTMIHRVPQVVFFTQSGLVAVDANTGAEYWHCEFPFSTSTAASPVVYQDLVYCSAGYGVGAGLFKIGDKAANYGPVDVWQKPNELMNHWSTPICHDGHLYGIYGYKKYGQAPLQCVELETGEIKWSQEGFGPGNCILVGDKILTLTDDGQLVIVDAQPDAYQEIIRTKAVNGKCWSTPAYSDGRVYVRSTLEGACLEISSAAGLHE